MSRSRKWRHWLLRVGFIVLAIAAGLYIWGSSAFDKAALTIVVVVALCGLLFEPDIRKFFKSIELLAFLKVELTDYPFTDQPEPEKTDSQESEHDKPTRWLNARLKLEWKIAYLAKHTLPDHLPIIEEQAKISGYNRPYANVGSLLYDGFLDRAEAERADLLLGTSWLIIAGNPKDNATEALLREAEDLARTVRAKVFRRLVEKYLKEHGDLDKLVWKGDRLIAHYRGAIITIWPTWDKAAGRMTDERMDILRKEGSGIIVIPRFPMAEPVLHQVPDATVFEVTLENLRMALDSLVRRGEQ
jgi:hypothetical protein